MTEALPSRRPVILVAEDEPGIRDALALLLGLEGYDVVTAADGMQALEALQSRPFDLVITDRMMPRMNGEALLHRVRDDARLRDIPAILISAVPRASDEAAALADAFVGKPFEATSLLLTIRRLLGSACT